MSLATIVLEAPQIGSGSRAYCYAVYALTKEGVHWVAPSLYMQVRDHGTRSWLFRYSRNGTNQWMGLARPRTSRSATLAAMLRSRSSAAKTP